MAFAPFPLLQSERQMLREMDREQRMNNTLNHIIDKLNYEINMDNRVWLSQCGRARLEASVQWVPHDSLFGAGACRDA